MVHCSRWKAADASAAPVRERGSAPGRCASKRGSSGPSDCLKQLHFPILDPRGGKHSGLIRAGVEPDTIVEDLRFSLDPAVPVHDTLLEHPGFFEERAADPCQVVNLLLGQRDARADTCV